MIDPVAAGSNDPADALGPLDHDLERWILSDGRWSSLDLIRYFLDWTGPARVLISTWTVGSEDAAKLERWRAAGDVSRIRLITDHSFATRQPHRYAPLLAALGSRNVRSVDNHAKGAVVLGRRRHAAFLGSANLNSNIRAESWAVSTDRDRVKQWSDALERLWSVGRPGSRRAKGTGMGREIARLAPTPAGSPVRNATRQAARNARVEFARARR